MRNGTIYMQASKIRLSFMVLTLVSFLLGAIECTAQTDQVQNITQRAKVNKLIPATAVKLQAKPSSKPPLKKKENPIMGEDDPDLDDDEEMTSDEDEAPPVRSQLQSPSDSKKKKTKAEIAKEEKAKRKRAKLLEGFRQGEEFHKKWFHLPSGKICASLDKLKKFCKAACTKKHCLDEQVANNCHLICPDSTTKQCADPLKQADPETEEVTMGSEEALSDVPQPIEDFKPKNSVSTSVKSSLDEAEKMLKASEGEGG